MDVTKFGMLCLRNFNKSYHIYIVTKRIYVTVFLKAKLLNDLGYGRSLPNISTKNKQ